MKKIIFLASFSLMCSGVYAQSVPSYISTNSLQGWYPFNGNANNEYGTGKNGVVLGPTLTSDRFGTANSAYYFNGTGGHINLDTTFFNVGWSNYTISCWLNTDTLIDPYASSNNQAYFNTEPHNGLELSLNYASNNKYCFFINSTPGIATWDIRVDTSSANIAAHSWKHIVFLKKNDTSYQFWVNGVLDRTFRGNTTASNYYCKIILGRIDTIHANEGFYGKLDDFGIWNRALAGCEITRLHNSSPYSYLTNQPGNAVLSPTGTAHFSVTDTGSGVTHQWQVNTGSGFVNLSNTTPYSGVTTPSLTVTPVTLSMNNYKYRCVVAGSICTDTSAFGKLFVWPASVNNIANNSSITISPNPTDGNLSINGVNDVNVKVYNSVGQVIKELYHTDNISIGEFAAGMYLIKIYDENNALLLNDRVIKK